MTIWWEYPQASEADTLAHKSAPNPNPNRVN